MHLQSSHFNNAQQTAANSNGGLTLRCTAEIDNLYERYTEKELGATSPNGDPIPARGKQKKKKNRHKILHALKYTSFMSICVCVGVWHTYMWMYLCVGLVYMCIFIYKSI